MDMILADADKKASIRQGKAVDALGLTFYPIRMSHYEQFVRCKDALLLRMGVLPVRYLSKDYFSAIFALEIDALKKGARAGILERVFRLFCLSLGIGFTDEVLENGITVTKREGEIVPERIRVTQAGREVEIEPMAFSSIIRPLIAELNGLELPHEEDNAELIKAYEQKNALSSSKTALKTDLGDLIASVAYLSGVSEGEINGWTVREFESRKRAIDRDKRYMLCAQAEMSGMASFKNGNPAPSWYFDVVDDTLGTMEAATLEKTLSGVADAR